MTPVTAKTHRPICPECRDGKHKNCDGTAWDFVADELVDCGCEVVA